MLLFFQRFGKLHNCYNFIKLVRLCSTAAVQFAPDPRPCRGALPGHGGNRKCPHSSVSSRRTTNKPPTRIQSFFLYISGRVCSVLPISYHLFYIPRTTTSRKHEYMAKDVRTKKIRGKKPFLSTQKQFSRFFTNF